MTKFTDIQDGILARLQASDIPNVWESAVPGGFVMPVDHGRYLPYALVSFGGKAPVLRTYQGIVSSRDDLKSTSVAVQCMGDSQRDTRVLAEIARDLLEGYSPDPDWGELSEQLSGDYTVRVPDSDKWPVRFAMEVVFNTYTNAVSE